MGEENTERKPQCLASPGMDEAAQAWSKIASGAEPRPSGVHDQDKRQDSSIDGQGFVCRLRPDQDSSKVKSSVMERSVNTARRAAGGF